MGRHVTHSPAAWHPYRQGRHVHEGVPASAAASDPSGAVQGPLRGLPRSSRQGRPLVSRPLHSRARRPRPQGRRPGWDGGVHAGRGRADPDEGVAVPRLLPVPQDRGVTTSDGWPETSGGSRMSGRWQSVVGHLFRDGWPSQSRLRPGGRSRTRPHSGRPGSVVPRTGLEPREGPWPPDWATQRQLGMLERDLRVGLRGALEEGLRNPLQLEVEEGTDVGAGDRRRALGGDGLAREGEARLGGENR